MALTQATPRIAYQLSDKQPSVRAVTVKAANTLYQGGAVALDTGESVPADGTLDNIGFARDNYAAGELALIEYGHYLLLPIASVAKTNIGAAVYASDDGTFSLSSSSAKLIGYVHDVENTGTAIVHITLEQTVV